MAAEPSEQTNEELVLGFLADGGDEYTSGEALSDKLGLSKTAVWKYVQSLRGKGYRIDALPARGYRLVEVPDRLSALELSPLLNTREIGITLHTFDSVASTNEVAYGLAQEGAPHGSVVVAEQQTAGRGRRGRTWISPPGLNLYCSIVLRPELSPVRAPELTLVAAVAVAEALEEAGVPAGIKWPNDLEVEGRKLAGILTELSTDADRLRFVILGIGVNLNARAGDLPEELRLSATSVAEVRGKNVARAPFAAGLWMRLEDWLRRHDEEGFEPVRAAWKRAAHTLGQDVLVRLEQGEFTGIAEDIDGAGALLVRTPDGALRRVLAGEIQQLRSHVRAPDRKSR